MQAVWIVFQKWAPAQLAYALPKVWRDPETPTIRARHDRWQAQFAATRDGFSEIVDSIPKPWLQECFYRAIKQNHLDNVKLLIAKLPNAHLDQVNLSFASLACLQMVSSLQSFQVTDELISNVVHNGTPDVLEWLMTRWSGSLQVDHVNDAMFNSAMLEYVLDRVELDAYEWGSIMNETLQLMDNEPCRIVASHAKVDKRSVSEALMRACEMGHTEKVQVLMLFTKAHAHHNRALLLAAENEFWDIVELLLEDPLVNPWDPIMGPLIFLLAVRDDELGLATVLLEHPEQEGQQARDIQDELKKMPDGQTLIQSFRGLISVKRLK